MNLRSVEVGAVVSASKVFIQEESTELCRSEWILKVIPSVSRMEEFGPGIIH